MKNSKLKIGATVLKQAFKSRQTKPTDDTGSVTESRIPMDRLTAKVTKSVSVYGKGLRLEN